MTKLRGFTRQCRACAPCDRYLCGAQRSRGVILAAVLASLVAVMMVGGTLTRTLVLHHRELRRMEHSQQSFWLAESALQRALHGLAASPDYQGETWRVEAGTWGGVGDAVALIRVEPSETPGGRQIFVEAFYPEHPPDRSLHRRQWDAHLTSDPGDSS
jgi:hypothetical protein